MKYRKVKYGVIKTNDPEGKEIEEFIDTYVCISKYGFYNEIDKEQAYKLAKENAKIYACMKVNNELVCIAKISKTKKIKVLEPQMF